MSATALGLVLFAALLHALWNVVAKRTGGDARFALIAALLLIVVWAPLGVLAAWDALAHWGRLEWAVLLASAIVHVFYVTTLLRGYRLADLTVVYPVARGTGPLLATLGALVWLGEAMSVVAACGVAGVAIGVFFIAGGPGLWAKAHDPAQRARLRAGIVLSAMRLAPISHVAPAREVSMLFAALIGGRLLGEGDRTLRLLGAASIGAGVGALALG